MDKKDSGFIEVWWGSKYHPFSTRESFNGFIDDNGDIMMDEWVAFQSQKRDDCVPKSLNKMKEIHEQAKLDAENLLNIPYPTPLRDTIKGLVERGQYHDAVKLADKFNDFSMFAEDMGMTVLEQPFFNPSDEYKGRPIDMDEEG